MYFINPLCIIVELTPAIVAESFYNGEIEAELRRVGLLEHHFRLDSDRQECMRMLEIKRRQSVYPHINCTEECKKRGSLLYCSVS